MTRTAKLVLAPILLLLGFVFIATARYRFIDGDEGFYLLASRLILMHRKPYADFFFTQAPLLPYVYALWMKCSLISWNSARTLSASLTILLGGLLYGHVCIQTRKWLAGLSAAVLFASSTLVFAWFPIVKTFSLADVFLFSAYLIVSRLSVSSSTWLIVSGGLLFGLSVDTRSYLLLLTPVFLGWIFRNGGDYPRTKLHSTLWFCSGAAIAMAPCLYLFVTAPDTFLFNNLGYHAIRSSYGLIGLWQQKLLVIVQLFVGGPEGNGLQWSILFFVSFGFVFSTRSRGYAPRLAFQIAAVLAGIGLLPTPARLQYFCLSVPFLVVSAVCVVDGLCVHLESKQERLIAAAACVALFGIYLGVSAGDFRRYLITGDGVPGVQSAHDRGDWRLQRVIEVSQAIGQIASPGEMVASFWPGDIFQTEANPFPGFENDFGLPVSQKLSSRERARYHILSPDEIESTVAAHTPRVVVLRTVVTAENLPRMQRLADDFKRSLRSHGYALVQSIGGISIYEWGAKP